MRDNYYRLGEGFLIVYSITMRDTFVSVNRFCDHILQVKGIDEVFSPLLMIFVTKTYEILEQVPIILVGSKCDLDEEREVPTDEGRALAQKWNALFYETSAKTRVNVDEVFTELVRIVTRSKISPDQDEGKHVRKSCCIIM